MATTTTIASSRLQADHASSANLELPTLQIFSCEDSMLNFMAKLQRENKTECIGTVEQHGSRFIFEYKVTNDIAMVEMPKNCQMSWHSHPDLKLEEISLIGKLSDLEKSLISKSSLKVLNRISAIFDASDDPHPCKPSALDLINFAYYQRARDYISMPSNHILCLSKKVTAAKLPIDDLKADLENIGLRYGLRAILMKLVGPFFKEKAALNQALYMGAAGTAFAKQLKLLGYNRMNQDNFLAVIRDLGFDYRYINLSNS
jgi:hypothetical protein